MGAVAERNCKDGIHCPHVTKVVVARGGAVSTFICCHCGHTYAKTYKVTEAPDGHGPHWPGQL